jgi:Ca-activated chloride channel family protein
VRRCGLVRLLALAAALGPLCTTPFRAEEVERRRGFSVEITNPVDQDVVVGRTKIAAKVRIENANDIDRVEFLLADKVIFVDREAPYECVHDFGEVAKSWVIRAVAYHKEGISVSATIVTRKLDVAYFEQVNRVILWATVRDKSDRLVEGLTREDFRLFEDGKEQPIQEFSGEDKPITLALLIDTSGSMQEQMKEVQKAANGFVDTLKSEDKALVIAFDDKVFLLQDLTADREALKDAITSTEAIGSTAVYDELHAAFRKLRRIEGRKAIVLLSDGEDTSSQAGFDRVLEEAKAQNVLIYGIGLGVGFFDTNRRNVLKEFSEVTGGRPFFVKESKDLANTYQQIADELRRQYYLTYSTPNTTWDGRWIRIQVDARKSDLVVRARKGFFAVRAASSGEAPPPSTK